MEQFRREISALCQTHINYVEDPKFDYAYHKFWNILTNKILREGGKYDAPFGFSMWLRLHISDIVEDLFSIDDLILCITSGENSIGDRWLDKKMDEIGVEVAKSLLGEKF